MGGQLFYLSRLRRSQFQQGMAMLLLVPVLLELGIHPFGLDPLVVQLLAVARVNLGDPLFSLLDRRPQARDGMALSEQVLLRLDLAALAVESQQPAGEAFLRELIPGLCLLAVDGRRLLELAFHLRRALQVLARLAQDGALRAQRI